MENNQNTMQHNHCHSNSDKIKLGKKLKIVLSLFIITLLVSYLPLPYLDSLNTSLWEYISIVWWAVLLGLFLGGIIDYFVPEEFIFNHLGEKGLKSIIKAVFAGFLLSACSHGILALAIQLYKKGASIASVVTFLLATPWANLPLTFIMIGFFGVEAFYIIGAAMIIAVITGSIFLILEKLHLIEQSKPGKKTKDIKWTNLKNYKSKKGLRGVWKGSIDLANMTLWWILIGILLSALISAYVPNELFTTYMGATFTGLIMTLAIATIIEVCSEGSAPLAFEIYRQVGTIANPFVFLMAGVVTDYTEIGLLWTNIGKKTAIWLPIITVPQVLFVGYLFLVFL